MASRRHFLRLLAAAGAAAMMPAPMRALGDSRPALELFFPQDPLLTWFAPTYGALKPDGRRHRGIDLMAPKLSPVYAAADGIVQRVAEGAMAGRHMIVEHEDGWESWYLHLNNDAAGRDNGRADWSLSFVPGIEEGVRVTAGQQIAFVGDSGNAEGGQSHTHFELHVGGRILNPYPYLVEGQDKAAKIARQRQTAETLNSLCYPEATRPSVDGIVCPPPPQQIDSIPLGIGKVI